MTGQVALAGRGLPKRLKFDSVRNAVCVEWHTNHVLHFHYDEAVFALTVPKVLQDGPAVHDVLIGPQLDTRFTWDTDAGTWLECANCPETGWSEIISVNPEVTAAFQSLQDIKRTGYISSGPSRFHAVLTA